MFIALEKHELADFCLILVGLFANRTRIDHGPVCNFDGVKAFERTVPAAHVSVASH